MYDFRKILENIKSFTNPVVQPVKETIQDFDLSSLTERVKPFMQALYKAKQFGTGLAKGVSELATSPGYLADLVTGGVRFPFNISPEQIEREKQMLTPQGKTQKIGHVIGSLSPGEFAVKPGLEKAGVPAGLAFGIGLGIDILTPGPGEVKQVKGIFKGLSGLSTKLLEKFRGMADNITEQEFSTVLNRAKKEGIRQADEQLITSSLVRE